MSAPIVIVGAGLGGARLAAALRQDGYEGGLILVGEEDHAPYDRPPLSKAVLTGVLDRTDLNPDEFYSDNDIELRTGTRASSVDPDNQTVTVVPVHGGKPETLGYSALVLATGLRPRTLPFAADLTGVHVLRTIDDALALRAESRTATRAVVVGAGFIGCEVAASLKGSDVDVVVVEPAAAPFTTALGEQVGAMVGRIHAVRGVNIRTGVGVTDITGDARVTGVTLSDGTHIAAEIVVVGIGSTPVVDFLVGSGIKLADRAHGGGVSCDSAGRTSAAEVYALGDVANWRDAQGNPSRPEHWNNVVDQVGKVKNAMLGTDTGNARPTVPYFWSDQFDIKIQALGKPSAGDDVHVASDEDGKFVAYYSRGGTLTGVVGAGKPAAVMKMRANLLSATSVSELLV